MKFAYEITTERIVRRYWGDEIPAWYTDPPEGVKTAEELFSQQSRDELMQQAHNIHEAGTDYDPDTETNVGYLCYDPDTGEMYPDAEIKPLPDEAE